MEIHERIKAAVDARFANVKIFASEAEMPYPTALGYISGARKPGIDSIVSIIRATRVSSNWLLFEQGSMFDLEDEKKRRQQELLDLFNDWHEGGRWTARNNGEQRLEAEFFVHLFNNAYDIDIGSAEAEDRATELRSVFHGLDLNYFLYISGLGGEKETLARFFLDFEKTENKFIGEYRQKERTRETMVGMFCSVYNQRGASGLALPEWLSTPYPKITPEQVDDAIKWLMELKIQARPQRQGKNAGGWMSIPQQEWQSWVNVAVELAANGVTPEETLEAVKLAGSD